MTFQPTPIRTKSHQSNQSSTTSTTPSNNWQTNASNASTAPTPKTDDQQPILLIFNDFSNYLDTIWLLHYPPEQIPDNTRTQIQRTSEQLFDLMTRTRHANTHIILAGQRLTRPDIKLPREYRQSDLALAVSARISVGGNPLHALDTKDIHDDLNDPWKFKRLADRRHHNSPFGYAIYQTVDQLLYDFDLYDDGDIVRE